MAQLMKPSDDRRRTGLFEPTGRLRPLHVMIDTELPPPGREAASAEALLSDLVRHEFVDAWQYRGEGAPPHLPHGTDSTDDQLAGVYVEKLRDPSFASHHVRWAKGTSSMMGGIPGNMVAVARDDQASTTYTDLGPEAAADRREADATAVGAAEAVGADLLITTRPYALSHTWRADNGLVICTPDRALHIVSLYLRAQDQFILYGCRAASYIAKTGKGSFYDVGAQALLPSWWRWSAACYRQDPTGLGPLTKAVIENVSDVLTCRDDVTLAMNRVQNDGVADDAMRGFTRCLVSIMGSLDAMARVAHTVLQLTTRLRDAAWQHADWLSRVEAKNRALADLFKAPDGNAHGAQGAEGAALLTIVRQLRNTLHDVGLQTMSLTEGRPGGRRQTLFKFPADHQAEILNAVNRLGGEPAWGVRRIAAGDVSAAPDIFLDQIMPRTIQLLNEIMDATPVNATSADSKPPSDDMHAPEVLRSIERQLGVGQA